MKGVDNMLNFEKYKETIKGISINSFAMKDGKVKVCEKISCRECDFHDKNCSCGFKKTYWLYEEYKKPKIKILKVTKVILENLNDKYKWIAKDKNDNVWSYEVKPTKDSVVGKWFNGSIGTMGAFIDCFKKEIFDFLSWEDEEPVNIKELLENCEVIEDE